MENQITEHWNKNINQIPEFKVDPIVVLVLGLVTCGLYNIYWNIKVAEVLNAVTGRKLISSPIAFFAGCCFPISVLFFYLASKEGLPEVYKRTRHPQKDDTVLLLILGFFFPIAAAMIVQNDINKLYN